MRLLKIILITTKNQTILKRSIQMYKILKRVYACLFVYTLLLATCGKKSVKVAKTSRVFLEQMRYDGRTDWADRAD
jgi:hypothetical protein